MSEQIVPDNYILHILNTIFIVYYKRQDWQNTQFPLWKYNLGV